MQIKDRVIIVTGGANGIGAAICELFASEGAFVVIADNNEKAGQDLETKIGDHSTFFKMDATSECDWQHCMNFVIKKYGKVNCVINNVGITGLTNEVSQDPEHCPLDLWQKIHHVNLDSAFLGCKYAIKYIKYQKVATIINVSSTSGTFGVPNAVAYASAKSAIVNLTKSVALYCAENDYNIRCNCILPAAILTPMWDDMIGKTTEERKKGINEISKGIPLKRIGSPQEVAQLALFLATDKSSYITGAEFHIDGGILAGPINHSKAKNNV